MRFETGKSRTHLGQRGHDVSEAAGLGEGRALRADEHDVESLIGVDLDGDGVVGPLPAAKAEAPDEPCVGPVSTRSARRTPTLRRRPDS